MLDLILKSPYTRTPVENNISVSEKSITVSDRTDKPVKSMIKAVSWRIVGTIDTMVISYFVTGRLSLAISIGGFEVFTKTILYYFHERLWSHIHRFRLRLPAKSKIKDYELDQIK